MFHPRIGPAALNDQHLCSIGLWKIPTKNWMNNCRPWSQQFCTRAPIKKVETRFHPGHYLMLLQLADVFVGVIFFIPRYQKWFSKRLILKFKGVPSSRNFNPRFNFSTLQWLLQNKFLRDLVKWCNIGSRKKDSSKTFAFKKLHWPPFKDRIIFKLLLITYKSLNGLAAVYTNELLDHYTPCRSLRSSDSNLLVIPKTITVTYGDRSFAAIAPKL